MKNHISLVFYVALALSASIEIKASHNPMRNVEICSFIYLIGLKPSQVCTLSDDLLRDVYLKLPSSSTSHSEKNKAFEQILEYRKTNEGKNFLSMTLKEAELESKTTSRDDFLDANFIIEVEQLIETIYSAPQGVDRKSLVGKLVIARQAARNKGRK